MDWNCNLRPPFVTRPDNHLSFFYNYNYDPYQEMQLQTAQGSMVPQMMDEHNKNNYGQINNMNHYNHQEKKKQRLTSEQMESLEKSFQEEIKLDPDRKMKLAKELGMEPRQIAVWFQNRRARWRTKELERLYDALKLEYDAVSREKDRLQEEVLALRGVIKEQISGRLKAVSAGYNTEISGEETVESTSIMHTSTNLPTTSNANNHHHHHMSEGSYLDHHYNSVLQPPLPPAGAAYWDAAGLPTYQ